MEQSESINELAGALAKAQGVMRTADKDRANPFYHSQYADLASVWDACRECLTANGLCVVQTTSNENGSVVIITTLAHVSGQWIRGSLAVKPIKDDPQALGSAITYGRRYALAAIVGVAPDEDDDGEGAMGRGKEKKPPPREPEAKKPAPPPKEDVVGEVTNTVSRTIESVTMKKDVSKSTGKEFTKYTITDSERYAYATFSESFAKLAKQAKETGVACTINYSTNKYGNNITDIVLAPKADVVDSFKCPDTGGPVAPEICPLCEKFQTCKPE